MTNTKKHIAETFLRLAESKAIDKITVKDVADACGCTRQTFYYHFEDIVALIAYVLKDQENLLIEEIRSADTLKDGLRILVSFSRSRQTLIQRIMDSQKIERSERLLLTAARSCMEKLVLSKNPFLQMSHVDLETALTFYTYAIFGVLSEYSQTKNIDEALLVDQLCRLLQGELTPIEES